LTSPPRTHPQAFLTRAFLLCAVVCLCRITSSLSASLSRRALLCLNSYKHQLVNASVKLSQCAACAGISYMRCDWQDPAYGTAQSSSAVQCRPQAPQYVDKKQQYGNRNAWH
jgi:hypothetical protein